MKKLLPLLMLLFATNTLAENGCAEHALMVHRLSYWAPDYLTITNNWNNLCFTQAPSSLKSLSVITEINGQSTKSMEPDDFYSIIDNESTFTLTYMTKIQGENKTYTQNLSKRNGKLFCYNSSYRYETSRPCDYKSVYWNLGRDDISIISDFSVDFFQFNTFDYIVNSDDEMTDKGLLLHYAKELEKKGLKYSSDNPDLCLYITKEENTNIENVYVPHVVSTTRTNSETTGRGNITHGNYSSWGFGRSNTSETSTTETRDIGSTHTVANLDLYLQFTILNAKQMDRNTPPVIWQLTCKNHWSNERNLMDIMRGLRFLVFAYPSTSQNVGHKINSLGFFLEDKPSKTGIVSDVIPGSWADNFGIERGCVLKRIKKSSKYRGNRYIFQTGSGSNLNEEKISWGNVDFYFNNKTVKYSNENNDWEDNYGNTEVSYYFIPESAIE